MRLFGRRYDTGRPVCLEIADGKIARAAPSTVDEDAARRWPWIAPGLIDLQAYGYGGQEFCSADLTPEKVGKIARVFEAFGVTRFCPTVTTGSLEVLLRALHTIAVARESSPEARRQIVGIHLEGPYITRDDDARGAHPLEHIRRPDWDEFQRLQEAAGGMIRIVTMSVEFDTAPSFVKQVADTGVIVAIGHTAANPNQIRAAVDAGARLSTHLGNGSHQMMHRFDNYFWPQLADDRLTASLIVDGHHLTPEMVKTFIRAKTPERCLLVSDISGQAGLPLGRHSSDFCDVEILPEGILVVAGQRAVMAGAALPMAVAIPNVMHFAGVDLATAVRMGVDNPAKLLGIEPDTLEPGAAANLVQFDLVETSGEDAPRRIEMRATVADGNVVSGTLWQPEAADSPVHTTR